MFAISSATDDVMPFKWKPRYTHTTIYDISNKNRLTGGELLFKCVSPQFGECARNMFGDFRQIFTMTDILSMANKGKKLDCKPHLQPLVEMFSDFCSKSPVNFANSFVPFGFTSLSMMDDYVKMGNHSVTKKPVTVWGQLSSPEDALRIPARYTEGLESIDYNVREKYYVYIIAEFGIKQKMFKFIISTKKNVEDTLFGKSMSSVSNLPTYEELKEFIQEQGNSPPASPTTVNEGNRAANSIETKLLENLNKIYNSMTVYSRLGWFITNDGHGYHFTENDNHGNNEEYVKIPGFVFDSNRLWSCVNYGSLNDSKLLHLLQHLIEPLKELFRLGRMVVNDFGDFHTVFDYFIHQLSLIWTLHSDDKSAKRLRDHFKSNTHNLFSNFIKEKVRNKHSQTPVVTV